MAREHETLTDLFNDVAISIMNKKGKIQMWDEQWENASWSSTMFVVSTKTPISTNICSKNYISVMPNTEYYFQCLSGSVNGYADVLNLDKDGKFIGFTPASGYVGKDGVKTFTTLSNAKYIVFNMYRSYGATYKNDISINYPSTDTSYHPFNKIIADDFPSEIDSITLESLLPSGIGVVDLGTLTWVKYQTSSMTNPYFHSSQNVGKTNIAYQPDMTCDEYIVKPYNMTSWVDEKALWKDNAGSIYINDSATYNMSVSEVKSYLNGVLLFYKKAQ